MEFYAMKQLVMIAGILLLAVLFTGCAKNNNYLRPVDFVVHLHRNNIKVDTVNPLAPEPLGASDALEMKIGKSSIGIYKFDRSVKSFRERLARIEKRNRVFFNGMPYPIYEVSGSFFIVGLDKHPDKHRILKALRSFE